MPCVCAVPCSGVSWLPCQTPYWFPRFMFPALELVDDHKTKPTTKPTINNPTKPGLGLRKDITLAVVLRTQVTMCCVRFRFGTLATVPSSGYLALRLVGFGWQRLFNRSQVVGSRTSYPGPVSMLQE